MVGLGSRSPSPVLQSILFLISLSLRSSLPRSPARPVAVSRLACRQSGLVGDVAQITSSACATAAGGDDGGDAPVGSQTACRGHHTPTRPSAAATAASVTAATVADASVGTPARHLHRRHRCGSARPLAGDRMRHSQRSTSTPTVDSQRSSGENGQSGGGLGSGRLVLNLSAANGREWSG